MNELRLRDRAFLVALLQAARPMTLQEVAAVMQATGLHFDLLPVATKLVEQGLVFHYFDALRPARWQRLLQALHLVPRRPGAPATIMYVLTLRGRTEAETTVRGANRDYAR